MIVKIFEVKGGASDFQHDGLARIRIVASDFGEADAKYRRFAAGSEPEEITRTWGGPPQKWPKEPESIEFKGYVIL